MKRLLLVGCLAVLALSVAAQPRAEKLLFVYDEVNEQSRPYIEYFKKALAAQGLAYDEATAAQAQAMDPREYRAVLIHGMVMAFTTKSPVRDWLKSEKRLEGKPVALFVTANRWFLEKLYGQLLDLLKKDKAVSVDSVSSATKAMDDAAKEAAVRSFVARLK
jgi:hypothetical protein